MRTLALLALVTTSLPAAGPEALFASIRGGDLQALKNRLKSGAAVNAVGEYGLTPLMYAVMTAGPQAMRLLLDAGADVNASNAMGITALHMAAYDLEKTRMLLSAGANVNAAEKGGETPLLVAANRPGGLAVVRLLLDKGAKIVDSKAGNVSGGSVVGRAAAHASPEAMRLLIAKGADVSAAEDIAHLAAYSHCAECLRIALEGGAPPETPGKRARTALQDFAGFGDLEMVRLLVAKGADINLQDTRGYTALMRAAISYEPGGAAVVEYLLGHGADTKPRNETGETALSLAARSGDTPTVALLRKAGAPEPKTALRIPAALESNSVPESIRRSLALLQRIGEPVRKVNGDCTTCHNHSLPAVAVAMASAKGFAVDTESAKKEFAYASQVVPQRLRAIALGGGVPDFYPYQVLGLAAGGDAGPGADPLVHHISTYQEPSGRFKARDYRPPQEYTDITFTATAMRAMQLHPIPGRAAEFKDRVERAAQWLAAQSPRDTEEHALRLMGLSWAKASASKLGAAARALMALQRADGWGQTAAFGTDAYATGQSLYALHLAGVPANDAAYRRGIAYLLRTQRPDGSWYVVSRSHPVQPLIDGGYPYINHQWISASAGAWSTMALLAAAPEQSAAK